MEKHDEELGAVVQAFCHEEGISFEESVKVAVSALEYEVQRRKRFKGVSPCGGSTA